MGAEPHAVITDEERTVRVRRDLQNELAATMSKWFEVRREKKEANKEFKEELDKLEERAEQLIGEIRAGGAQLEMHFGSVTLDANFANNVQRAIDNARGDDEAEIDSAEEESGDEADGEDGDGSGSDPEL